MSTHRGPLKHSVHGCPRSAPAGQHTATSRRTPGLGEFCVGSSPRSSRLGRGGPSSLSEEPFSAATLGHWGSPPALISSPIRWSFSFTRCSSLTTFICKIFRKAHVSESSTLGARAAWPSVRGLPAVAQREGGRDVRRRWVVMGGAGFPASPFLEHFWLPAGQSWQGLLEPPSLSPLQTEKPCLVPWQVFRACLRN